MKKTNTLYWVVTGVFAAFMLFTAIPDIMMVPDAVTFMNHLGYPNYFIPFIGIAKSLGAIAIIIPGYPRIKEWAYAGLIFDLIGAMVSSAAVDGMNGGIIFITVVIAVGFYSYFLYHKRQNMLPAHDARMA